MADGNLTFEAFLKLSIAERCERYKDLSDHDKFRVRLSMDPGAISPPCNRCKYYRGYAKCDAFPDGITSEQIGAVEEDQAVSCGAGYHFTPKEDV